MAAATADTQLRGTKMDLMGSFKTAVAKLPLVNSGAFHKLHGGAAEDGLEDWLCAEQEQLVAVRQIPGKGRGLVALDLIGRGQLIIKEVPMCQQPSLPQHPKLQRQTHAGCGIASVLWDSAASETLNDIMLTGMAPQLKASPQSKPIQTIREAPEEPPKAERRRWAQRVRLRSAFPCASFKEITINGDEETAPRRPAQPPIAHAPDCAEKADVGSPPSAAAKSRLSECNGVKRTGAGQAANPFPVISCINHSCLPNAHASWNQAQRKEVVYALKDIQPGEEIVVTYTRLDADSQTRQQQLQDRFGFQCDCRACISPREALEKSDKRRRKMAELDALIPVLAQRKPYKAVRCVEELVRLVDKEGILDTSLKARAFYDAFQICLSYPQVGDAKRYAMLAFRNYLTCRGADSPCTLRLHGYMMNPESHPASQTAKQYAEAVRRNIESERFWSSGGRRKRRSPGSKGKLSGSTAAAGGGHRSDSHEGVTGIAEAAPAENDSEGRRWLANSLLDSHLGPGLLHEASLLEHSSCDSLLLDSGYAPFVLQENPRRCSSNLSADKAEPAEGSRAGAQPLELAKKDSAMQYKVLDLAGTSSLAGDQSSCFRSELFNTQDPAEQYNDALSEAEVADHDQPSADTVGVEPQCQIVEAALAISKEQVTGSDEKTEGSRPASPEQCSSLYPSSLHPSPLQPPSLQPSSSCFHQLTDTTPLLASAEPGQSRTGWQPESPPPPSKTLTSFLKQRGRQQHQDGAPDPLPLRLKRTAVGTVQPVARRKPLGEAVKKSCRYMSKLLRDGQIPDSVQECRAWQQKMSHANWKPVL